MALFDKFKKGKPSQPQETAEQKETSTLDLIKETMAQAQSERAEEKQEEFSQEELKRAQEAIARATAAQQAQAQGTAKVGANAPINASSLKAVINAFTQTKSQENLTRIMECLQSPQTLVTVPAKIITSKENQEKLKQGGNVRLEGPMHISPVIFTDNQGKKVFPLFSGEDMVPKDLSEKTPKVNMPFAHCLNIIKNMKDVDTFALDPYTANIRIGVNQEPPKQA